MAAARKQKRETLDVREFVRKGGRVQGVQLHGVSSDTARKMLTELQELHAKSDGEILKTEDIVDAAHESEVLGDYIFHCDVPTAADLYYEGRARRLISGLRVTVLRDSKPVKERAFINVNVGEARQGYVPAPRVVKREDYQISLLTREMSRIRSGLESLRDGGLLDKHRAIQRLSKAHAECVVLLSTLTKEATGE